MKCHSAVQRFMELLKKSYHILLAMKICVIYVFILWSYGLWHDRWLLTVTVKISNCIHTYNVCDPICDLLLSKYLVIYTIRNFWVSGLYLSSGVWRNTTFWELDLFPSSGKKGEEDTYSLGPLERANLNHWTTAVKFTQLFKHLRPG
jgi:hypothetical protein